MASDGWVAISRELLDARHDLHPHTTGSPACELGAWVDLIGYARWSEAGGLGRGELQASQRFLAARWNWSKGRVKRFLDSLEDAGRIKRQPVKGPRTPDRISICNYDTYQEVRTANGPASRPANGPANGPKEEQEQEPLTTTAAVGEFLERTGSDWRLDKTIPEWCREIESTAKYQGVDFEYEIQKCADWHVGKSRTPKAPDMSLRNWLENAAERVREKAKSNGDGLRMLS